MRKPRGAGPISLSCWWALLFMLVLLVAIASYVTLLKMDVFCQMVITRRRGGDLPVRILPLLTEEIHTNSPYPARAWHPLLEYGEKEIRWERPTTRFGCKKFYQAYEWKSYSQLPRQLTHAEHWRMLNLLVTADWLLSVGNFSYMLYGGTLLGSWLFHDFIPWDEDVDILVSHADKDELMKHLEQYGGTEYKAVNHFEFSKFFPASGERISRNHKWTWPYLDIGYYGENDTHVWEIYRSKDERRTFPKSVVFPLHPRPLAGRWFTSPQDSHAFMKIMLSKIDRHGHLVKEMPTFKCQLGTWDHRHEKSRKTTDTVDCHNISSYYPVVHTHKPVATDTSRGVIERLVVGNKTLQECYIDEPSYATHYPLSFKLMP